MGITDLPLLGMLKTKMNWHQTRQSILAENIANADTPDFKPSDLEPMKARDVVRRPGVAAVGTATTHASHITGPALSRGSSFTQSSAHGWETTPAGNSVVLEEQMMKVSANQFDFQMASTLYSKSLQLLKTAVGRS